MLVNLNLFWGGRGILINLKKMIKPIQFKLIKNYFDFNLKDELEEGK